MNVTFNNLISEIQFSQPFFEPSLGETQLVTASFAENSDWTLQIEDVNSNIVRTVTGTGNSLAFDWDGTGNGETNIPDGVYTYVISAITNGLANEIVTNGGTGNIGSPPSPDLMSDLLDIGSLWVVNTNNETVVPLEIYPPTFDTNDLTIIRATSSEIKSLQASSATDDSSFHDDGFTPDASSPSSTPSSQTTSAPTRPPSNGVKNSVGTIGICYQRNTGANVSVHSPTTGWPYDSGEPYYVQLGGQANANNTIKFPVTTQTKSIADGFKGAMQTAGFSCSFEYADDQVVPSLIESSSLGGSSVFNNVNLGFLLTHGANGVTAEDDGVKYSYVFLENVAANNAPYLHFSDFNFGSSSLRWMTMLTCDNLNQTDYNSMNGHSKNPINGNLHVFNGASSVIYFAPDIGNNYANNLTFGGQHWCDPVKTGQVLL